MVPAPAAFGEIAAAAGNDDIEDGKAAYGRPMGGRQRVCRRTAPIMADEMDVVVAQLVMHQPPDVISHRALVVSLQRTGAIAKSA